MPLRVCGSTVGATMRTVPAIGAPPAGVTVARRARLDLRQVGRRDLGAPLEPALADQAEQLLAGADSTAPTVALRAEMTPSSGASTAVWPTLQLARLQRRALGVEAGARGALGGDVLVDRRFAERAGRAAGRFARSALAAASPSGRLGLGDGGARLRQVGLHRVGSEGRQHLAALDDVADVDAHLGQAQAVRLGADAGLLPGRDVAVGARRDRHRRALRLGDDDAQRGLGRDAAFLSSAALARSPKTSAAVAAMATPATAARSS